MHPRFLVLAFLGSGVISSASPAQGSLTGAGATFPAPIYNKWFNDYAAKTGVKINYQSIGSGGGVKQIQEQTVDFGASDGPMSDDELSHARGGKVLHFPSVLGAVVVTYNLPGVSQSVHLTADVVADIFLGKITKWNDARLVSLNGGVKLPASDILVVHRSDGSGTTYIWTDYLSAVSPAWAKGPGRGKDVQWPVGLGGKGNEGVAGQIKQTPGSLGYVEIAYAIQNKLAVAKLRNASGVYVEPTIAAITAAAEGAKAKLGPTSDYRVSIVNAAGKDAYPVASFTWLLVYENQPDAAKGKMLLDFMRWMYTEGQLSAPSLDYGPLPGNLSKQLLERLKTIKMGAARQ